MTEIKERTEVDSERIEETAKAMYDDLPQMFYADDLNSYAPWEYAPTYVQFNARQMAKSAIKGADGYLGRKFTEDGIFVCGNPHCDMCAAENDLNGKIDQVYRERNQLVSALSKHYPSYLGKHDGDERWEVEWLVVYIELPTGQVSWHTHASDLDLFDHLERREGTRWDGHNTEEKYERLAQLDPKLQEQISTWSRYTFGTDLQHIVTKLRIEFNELNRLMEDAFIVRTRSEVSEAQDRLRVADEVADVMHLLFQLADFYGFDLLDVTRKKFSKNLSRSWVQQQDGTYQHS